MYVSLHSNMASAVVSVDIVEVRGDVFEEWRKRPSAAFVHCISSDAVMGKGVAGQFIARYGKEQAQLIASLNPQVGEVVATRTKDGIAFHLITKDKYFHKPTLDSLHQSLVVLEKEAKSRGIERLVMPRIGCGLDKLDWKDVLPLIRAMNIECIVCIVCSL
jgi:O-acetyl-ADP-ribose deacetylase (regulator of RNase III)